MIYFWSAGVIENFAVFIFIPFLRRKVKAISLFE